MGVKDIAIKNILKRKLHAEQVADSNLDRILKDENVRMLFVKCKRLVVDIAKIEVDGGIATAERREYNDTRELLGGVLESMGVDKSEMKPKYTCAICKDTGYIRDKMCSCLKQEISKELIKISGLNIDELPSYPEDFTMFDNPKDAEAIYSNMRKFIDSVSTTAFDNILIIGDTGVGKTHLMKCMISHALGLGITLKFATAFNFNQDMLKYHCARLEDKEELIENYLNSDLLFIDDLGSENKINNVTNEYLYLVINERMMNHKKTVISTNLDLKQLQDVYGERIFSRLMHKKQSLKINFKGKDLRLKGF